MRWKVRTGVVVSTTVALVALAFVFWRFVPGIRESLSSGDRASAPDSQVAAAKSSSAADAARARDATDASRKPDESAPLAAAFVRVHVCDEAGAPIAAARVGFAKPAALNRNGIAEAPLEFVDGTEAKTSAAGECSLALPETDTIVDVAATAEGFAPGFWPRARAGDAVRLELQRAAELTGFVRDRAGAPVAGATLRAISGGRRETVVETKSAADGSYRLGGLFDVRSHLDSRDTFAPEIEVHRDGFPPLHFSSLGTVERSDARHWKLDVYLMRGGRLRGRIVDLATNVAVAGADVFLRGVEKGEWPPPMRTKSGADGRFLFEGVPSIGVQNSFPLDGWWNARLLGDLCVVAAGHGSGWRRIHAPDDEDEIVVDFELPPVCDVRGAVVDERGAPLAAAQLELRQTGGVETICSFDLDHRFALDDPAVSIHADGDGRYLLHDVPVLAGDDARTEIWADAKSASGGALARTRVEVALVAGAEVVAPDLVLKPAVEVVRPVVHFVDEAGRDVAGAAFLTFIGPDGSSGSWESRADGTGRSTIYGIDASSPSPQLVRVVARNEGFATAVVELPQAPTETTITLKPEHRLHGVVRDVDGRPGIADVSAVTIGDANGEIPGVGGYTQTSPASGRFSVRALSASPWRVVATRLHDDGTCESAVVESVTDENTDLEIVLKRSGEPVKRRWWEPGALHDPAFGCIEIVVRMAGSGQPVVHAEFSLGKLGHERKGGQPIAPGRFRIDHVEPGEMPLEVAVKNALAATRSIAVNAGATTEVTFEIDAGRTLAGHLALDELPKGCRMTLIASESTRGEEAHFAVATDGSFQLRGLDPACSYRLALDFVEHNCEQYWICAEAPRKATDGDADWRPHFAPARWIAVSRGKEKRLPAGTLVRFVDAAGRDADVCVARGYELPLGRQLLPGSYTVRLELPDGTMQEQPLTVATGDERGAVHFEEP